MAGSQNNYWGQHDLNRYANAAVIQEETKCKQESVIIIQDVTIQTPTLTFTPQHQEY